MTNTEQTSVLITGGNKGLGFEAARRLGAQGWTIFLGSRDHGRGREAADELTAGGADVTMVPLDVTSDDSVTNAVRIVQEHVGQLDVLVNNAATGTWVAPEETTAHHLGPIFETNVLGPVRVTRAFLPLLRASDNPRVVMVSSEAGSLAITTDPERPESQLHELAYTSSKAALNMLTTQYAKAIPEIRFNIASPGYTATDFNNHMGHQSVTEGTDAIVELAMIGADGPTGTFIDRHGRVPW